LKDSELIGGIGSWWGYPERLENHLSEGASKLGERIASRHLRRSLGC